jgi:hypothetical protein
LLMFPVATQQDQFGRLAINWALEAALPFGVVH